MLNIGIINYGTGNIASLKSILSYLGHKCVFSNNIDILKKSDFLILPGVGSYSDAIKNLKLFQVDHFIKEFSKQKPILGICLGMQLLATSSEENGYCKGLDIIPGEIKKIQLNLYHTGWNKIKCKKDTIFEKYNDKEFYFNHSYSFVNSGKFVVGTCNYNDEIVSIINKGNIFGVQFHPEKSQTQGKAFLIDLLSQVKNA